MVGEKTCESGTLPPATVNQHSVCIQRSNSLSVIDIFAPGCELSRHDELDHRLFFALINRLAFTICLLYTYDAADESTSVDVIGQRNIK
ncbi:hypothetical protein L2X83_16760, partial [Enterobacter asburiae]|nr:hypothetical protein [Enterobacter asburiae]